MKNLLSVGNVHLLLYYSFYKDLFPVKYANSVNVNVFLQNSQAVNTVAATKQEMLVICGIKVPIEDFAGYSCLSNLWGSYYGELSGL